MTPVVLRQVGPYECQAYAVGRGYASLLGDADGADLIAPAGLAWQVAIDTGGKDIFMAPDFISENPYKIHRRHENDFAALG